MRKILSFVFFFTALFSMEAQNNAVLKFVDPEVAGSKYRISVRLYRQTGQMWKVGSGNYRMNYPQTVIANPTVSATTSLFQPAAGFANTPTTTGSNASTGLFTYNPVLSSTTIGLDFPAGDSLTLYTIEFDILNAVGLSNVSNKLVWRTTLNASPNPRVAITTAASTSPPVIPVSAVTLTNAPDFAPLPIELLSFNGKAQGEVNTFRWEVASQTNVSHFVVERSLDGVNNFREVTERIKAAGTTTTQMTYSADDKKPISLGYYRLKAVDFDGSTNYSNVVAIDRRNTKFGVIEVAPNPTLDVVRVNFESNTRGDIQFMVTDVAGRILKTQSSFATVGNNYVVIDLTDLTSGTYFISMTDGNNTKVEKVVKQ
jgi:hypothetical protein